MAAAGAGGPGGDGGSGGGAVPPHSARSSSSATPSGPSCTPLATLRRAYNTDAREDSLHRSGECPDAVADRPALRCVLTASRSDDLQGGVVHSNLRDVWDEVSAETARARAHEGDSGKVRACESDDPNVAVTFKEVRSWVDELPVDSSALRFEEELATPQRCCCLRRRSSGLVPKLDKKLTGDGERVLMLRQTPFDFENVMHCRILRTIYSKLTRNFVCPVVGSHWEDIGFVIEDGGAVLDPRIELNVRGDGLLSAIHLVHFLGTYGEAMKAMHVLSRVPQRGFPFAAVSCRVTRMVVDALLAGKASSICRKERSVLGATCSLHAAGLSHFHATWRAQSFSRAGMRELDEVLKELTTLMRRKPTRLIKGLRESAAKQRQKQDPLRLHFTELGALEQGKEFGGNAEPQPKRLQAEPLPKRLQAYGAEEASP
eukprot:NODE_5406_length_1774_cov_6.779599.p1 GENE.NODE_5406_length_1774_cov_6.779599~~NODE_5406_length_1774_cov_6.779599.p1  ORF type:complete len:461 (-),score=96.08 NODE_5406_length_1774_cov_6.779599:390-1679(-)